MEEEEEEEEKKESVAEILKSFDNIKTAELSYQLVTQLWSIRPNLLKLLSAHKDKEMTLLDFHNEFLKGFSICNTDLICFFRTMVEPEDRIIMYPYFHVVSLCHMS